MQLRNARDEDFMGCVHIARRAWPEFKERESIYHLFCKFFSNTSFVIEREGQIVAFLLGFLSQVDRSQAYIHLVAVDPSAQRQGLASQLYRTFFETVSSMQVRQVRLIVNPDNAPSLAFHHSFGFQVDPHGEMIDVGGVPAVKDYNGPGLHMVPFSLTLS